MAQAGGKRLLILGGGISGLSYAHYLRTFSAALDKSNAINKITILEANDYMGGSIKTNQFDDGGLHELGPRSIRNVGVRALNTAMLIEQLGLSDKVITIRSNSPAAKNRYLYVDGKMHLLPTSFLQIFKKLPASDVTIGRTLLNDLMREPMKLEKYPDKDPPLYDFIKYRFGPAAAENIADPVLRGITAGDVRQLSTRALLGDLLDKEQTYGSVIRSMSKPTVADRTKHDELFPVDYQQSKLLSSFKKEGVLSFSLTTGLQSIAENLSNSLLNTNEDGKISIYNRTKVTSVEFNTPEAPCLVEVETVDGDRVTMTADHVISTIPAKDFIKILPDSMPMQQSLVLENLGNIPHSPVACVCVEYKDLKGPLPSCIDSFGFLTHSKSGCRVLGISFDSTMFSEIDKPLKSTRMTCMIGGSWFKEMVGIDDLNSVNNNHLEQIALEEISRLIGVSAEPFRISTWLWKTGIAQYSPGHNALVKKVRNQIEKLSLPLTLLGQSYDGISVNDVLFTSRMASYRFIKSL